jgi:hypothetical protein
MDDDDFAYQEELLEANLVPVVLDDEEDDQLTEVVASRRKATRKKFDGPSLSQLYPGATLHAAASVEKKIRPVWASWDDYCKASNYSGKSWEESFGLSLYGHKDNPSSHDDYNHERVDGFFTWLSNNGYPKTAYLNAKLFLNTHLRLEYTCRLLLKGNYAPSITVNVGESQVIKRCIKACNAQTATVAMKNCVDIQVDLNQLLSPEKIHQLLLAGLKPQPGGLISKMECINRLIFCSIFTSLSQTTRRGEELYSQKLVQRSTTFLREIGPFGILAAQYVTNKAKHNKEGWLEYTSMLPHMDPIRDSAAWNGFLLVWRIQISNETFPDFSGSSNYNSIFGVPSYPSAKDPRIPITPEACHSIFDKVFSDCDAVCAKLVHQPRFQAIQEMDRAGISEQEWTRMSGHKGKDRKVHHRSYAHNPPSICLVQRAGGDFQTSKHSIQATIFQLPMNSCFWTRL